MKQSREDNRNNFPATARILDEFRDVFGDGVKVVYACENGREIGKQNAGEEGKTVLTLRDVVIKPSVYEVKANARRK